MRLSEFKARLHQSDELRFQLPDTSFVSAHFHVTEVGMNTWHFLDCGGRVHLERTAALQLWEADDRDHRLSPKKLLKVLQRAEKMLGMEDLELEVLYQTDTLGKYGLDFKGTHFVLVKRQADCLAKDTCGIPEDKPRVKLSDLGKSQRSCCTSASSC